MSDGIVIVGQMSCHVALMSLQKCQVFANAICLKMTFVVPCHQCLNDTNDIVGQVLCCTGVIIDQMPNNVIVRYIFGYNKGILKCCLSVGVPPI